jgi:hypothetical protein
MTQKRRLFLFSLPTEATTNQPRCKVRMWPEMQPRSSRRVKLVFQYDDVSSFPSTIIARTATNLKQGVVMGMRGAWQ